MKIPERAPLRDDENQEIRDLFRARLEMEDALAEYRKAAATLKRAEERVLGHYPRSARPGPFYHRGCVMEVNDVDSDHEWRFTFTPVVDVP